ncbi:unnamed protein product [Kluyveromyces dobzhanskii CBS 2104]|uniref:WGS project CCBQ000000000 data, contig 00014 n=1 Tax=Kluyveromyces dobzhanskii CBS 2104 TaxID=1427455 RepID=A0A0A8L6J3_9SACH|nr:unnamed protein product [Kluyveromyces dobzhanskii CBS 2104]
MYYSRICLSFATFAFNSFVNSQSVSSFVSTSCETIPEPTLETTPVSTTTRTMTSNGETYVGVTEIFRSITYVSDCAADDYDVYTSTLVIW